MESPNRLNTSQVLSTLPLTSPTEDIFNCFLEQHVEPLSGKPELSTPQSSPSSHQGSKSKKTPKQTPERSPNAVGSKSASAEPLSSDALSQPIEWAASATKMAKNDPEMAYKLFARAGQAYAKQYRPREAALNYYAVVQLQIQLIKARLLESGCSTLMSSYSMIDVHQALQDQWKELITRLLVLFKAFLYLARLVRPYEPSLSSSFYRSCIECVFPSHRLRTTLATITNGEPKVVNNIVLSAHDYMISECRAMVKELSPILAYVDEQRQASTTTPLVTLASEIFGVCREAAGALSLYVASPTSLLDYELAIQLATFSLQIDPGMDVFRQALVYEALGSPHIKADYLINSLSKSATTDSLSPHDLQSFSEAFRVAITLGDETRLHRYIQATEPRRVDFEAEPRSRLLLRLALILLQNDDAAYEYLSQEEWALRLMRSNPQLAACFQGVKERL